MDPISDMLTRIKNAQSVKAERVLVPLSGIKSKIAGILKEAGYIEEVGRKKRKIHKTEREWLDLKLHYYEDRAGAISGLKIISKPSRHIYIKAGEIRPVRSGHGVAIISTSKGVMTSKEARKLGLGGEVLFEVW